MNKFWLLTLLFRYIFNESKKLQLIRATLDHCKFCMLNKRNDQVPYLNMLYLCFTHRMACKRCSITVTYLDFVPIIEI